MQLKVKSGGVFRVLRKSVTEIPRDAETRSQSPAQPSAAPGKQMAYPTDQEFRDFLDANPARYKQTPEADGYNSTADILAEITRTPMVANTDPVEQVPKPLKIADLQGLLSEGSLGRLSDSWWEYMRTSLLDSQQTPTGDPVPTRGDAAATVDNANSRGNLTDSEATALKAELLATVDDPDYQTDVPGKPDCYSQWTLGGMSAEFVNSALGR